MANKMPTRFGVLIFVIAALHVFAADAVRKDLLRDGFVFAGADGRLTESEGIKLFVFESEITDGKATLKAGESLELLPSATLEKMTDDVKQRVDANYRLWGKVTRYGDRNFVFPVYFLPLRKADNTASQQRSRTETTINASGDILNIPNEVTAKLQAKDVFDTRQPTAGLELKADSILADRTGCLVRKDDGRFVLQLDALGRSIQADRLELLPCESLQDTVNLLAKEPRPARFNIAGIVTTFNNENYILLQRAIPAYSHGNFTQ